MPEPVLTEEYQIRLKDFIAAIPVEGSAVRLMSMKPESKTLKTPYTKADLDALKGVVEDQRFFTYTGYTHMGLLTKWLDPANRTTTCNEFCTKCGTAMGYKAEDNKDGVGRFDIADYLTRYGRGHCWVPATSGARPEYGDIFRIYEPSPDQNGVARNHMGVGLWFEGDTWHTVESGQAGPSSGYDAIERKSRTWPVGGMQGWVSMKALLGSGNRLPYWLGGWWEVEEGMYEVWYYYFAAPNRVYYSDYPPRSLSAPPSNAKVVGSFDLKGMFGVNIRWNSADVDETFMLGEQDSKKRKFSMTGKTARGIPLTARRMMIEGLL